MNLKRTLTAALLAAALILPFVGGAQKSALVAFSMTSCDIDNVENVGELADGTTHFFTTSTGHTVTAVYMRFSSFSDFRFHKCPPAMLLRDPHFAQLFDDRNNLGRRLDVGYGNHIIQYLLHLTAEELLIAPSTKIF